jgi:APA family basic amino acid/polyamine antiporter
MERVQGQSQPIQAQLGLWDAVSIIIGIVIGAGIYETPPIVFKGVTGPGIALAVWAVAGLLCLVGALCYAELASTYPRLGGDYVYLTRAYGSAVGFLYGWAQLAVIQTGSIGMMAYIFADYAARLWGFEHEPYKKVLCALLAVAAITIVNILGVSFGKGIQNLLTGAKILGLGGILVAGILWGSPSGFTSEPSQAMDFSALAAVFVPVFLTYGGWNDAAFVAAEVRGSRRNIAMALILGTIAVTVIYLLVNVAYLLALGFEGCRHTEAIAADTLQLMLGTSGSNAMCLLVMISALGAINGLTFTSSRIYAALGSEHSIFARLSRWHPRLGSPVWSLGTQALICLTMIATVGTEQGQRLLDSVFVAVGLGKFSWAGGFGTLLQCTAPVFWLFFLLSGVSLFVLRYKDRGINRPFSVPLFPVIPLIFCATCAYMLYGGIRYAQNLGLVGGVLVLAGLPLYALSTRRTPAEPAGVRGSIQ